ncbi:MAG: transglutaminase family protein [Kineosporiaceae bacterium]
MNLSSAARAAVAAWLASMLASVTIFPLVQGTSWYLALGFLAALVGAAGLVVRRFTTSAPVVVGVQVVVWLVAVCAIFLPDTATFGLLPGADAVAAARELFTQGITVMHKTAPPVPDTAGTVFVTTTGLALVALTVDVVAVTLRRPAVAGLPLLAVYCVPAAILPDGLDWTSFLVSGAGFLILVAADSFDRVQAWGRILGGRTASRWSTGLDGARGIAAASLAVAIVLPVFVPGLGERALTGSGGGRGRGHGTVTVINPLLQLRKDLADQSNTPVITYTTTMTDPQPLRIVVDDDFTGDAWQPSPGEVSRTQLARLGAPSAPGLGEGVAVQDQRTSISVGPLGQSYLPLPYPWRSVDVPGNWYYDANTLNVVGEGVTAQNLHYTVDHYTVDPTDEQLRTATETTSDAILRPDLSLPPDVVSQIRPIAHEHAGNAVNDFDKAVNLRNWLRTFSYSTQAPGDPAGDSSVSAIKVFLDRKSGYCVHFASAMAVMARTLGIPARVAVGFLPGTENADRVWTITLRDAHAWPELYFEGIGWVRFEPTPTTRTQGVGDVVTGGRATSSSGSAAPSLGASGPTPSTNSKLGKEAAADPSAAGLPSQSFGWRRIAAEIPWAWVAVLAVLLMLAATPAAAAALARRVRWRRAGGRQARAEAALEELGERLSDLGVRVAPSLTPRALRQWLVGAEYVPTAATEPLDRLVAEVETARYAPPGGGAGPDADELRAWVREVAATVADQVPPARRRLARAFPATGVTVLTGAARTADAVAEGTGRRVADQVGSEVRKLVGPRRR